MKDNDDDNKWVLPVVMEMADISQERWWWWLVMMVMILISDDDDEDDNDNHHHKPSLTSSYWLIDLD